MTDNFLKIFGKSAKRKAEWQLRRTFVFAILTILLTYGAYATISGTWATNGNQSATTNVNGVTITWSGTPGSSNYTNGTLNSTSYWTDPFNGAFGGGTSLQMLFNPFGTSRTITVTFSQPVDNPVLHVGRIGGANGTSVSTAVFTLGSFTAASSNVTITRLSGNSAFQVNTASKSFQRVTGTTNNNTECTNNLNQGTGCGSVQFNGTGITSLTFDVTWAGASNNNTGDGIEVRWSLGSTVVVRKQSVNSSGNYSFSGTNGIGSFSLNTAVTNPATSTQFPIPNSSQNITITESAVAGTILTGVNCTDPAGNTVPSSVSNRTATLTPANYASVNQLITCTFINSPAQPALQITKTNNGPWTVGGSGAVYSLTATNIGGLATSGTITVRDALPTGITPNWTGTRSVSSNGVNWSCSFSGQNVTCTTANSINYTGTNSSVITLPVNVGVAANTGNPAVNYASVGGGGDIFNGGSAPTPGTSCTDSTHCTSNSATITNQPPVTNDINAPPIQNTAGSTGIPALTGSDPDGTVAAFRIDTLPSASSGTLYLCNAGCTPVSAGQIIPLSQAANLQFDPNSGFSGNAVFNYSAIDNLGTADATPASFTIPLGYSIGCSTVYASAFSSGRTSLYELNGATMTPVLTAPQTVGGLAISANGLAYYDNGTFSTPPLYSHDGATQTNTGATVPGLLVGEAADSFGNVYYIDSAHHLRRVNAGASGAASDLGAITFAPGDTIGPTLQYGDMTFDGNGRLFWYSSVNGSGASYLYIVNINTRVARNAGQVGPNGATGAAFDGTGRLITTTNSGQTVVSIDISSPTLAATTLGTANPTIYDLGSCAGPIFNPNLTAQKSVANITLGQNPAITANVNDVLEYTVIVTNTGNLSSSAATLSDAIPAGTTYVANSTTLNGNGVADAGGAMPFATANSINSNGQPAGVISPAGGTATVRFRVRVNTSGLPPEIRNTATTQFLTTTAGVETNQTVNSNETITPTFLAPPNVSLVKSCPSPANCETAPQLSGTDLTYSIQFTNTGGQSAAGLAIVDAIPANTDFQINSASANPGTSGLTFIIEFSSDYNPGNPSAATWNYTPVPAGGGAPNGYDRLVKAIRWRVTSGSLSNTAPNNAGSVNFIVKIR
ncbi:MAG: DUF11 domain-containing protein [Pyrinomonadaceae bacterium]